MTTQALRPKEWAAFVGQAKVKERLGVQIDAAKARRDPLKHILLTGDSGCGKTALSELIAREMHSSFQTLMITPSLKIEAVNRGLLELEDRGGTILWDEIHNFSKKMQHYLYSILEDGRISFDTGKSVPIEAPFTIIGATTEPGMLSKPLYDRFPIKHRLENYSDEEMSQVVKRMADRVGVMFNDAQLLMLGKASAGTPRQARNLVFAARDLGTCKVSDILDMTGITDEGLTEDHLSYLQSLEDLGGISGIDNISNHSGRPKEIIIDIEKLLVRRNFVELQRKGRVLTVRGMKALQRAIKGQS